MHGRKRESTASRLERRAKSLPKVKLLQKLHKEIVHLQNADDNEKGKDGGGGDDDDDDDHVTKTQKKMESLMLTLTQKLVEIQPEMITCWNKRKARFCLYVVVRQQKNEEEEEERLKNVVKEELHVSEQGLRRNPKSYCAWEHRRWVIARLYDRILSSSSSSSSERGNEDSSLLPFMKDVVLREREMLETLLNADDRNFHAWNYRRFVVDKITRYHFNGEHDRMNEEEVADDVIENRTREEEAKYAREKISKNFSNYSAWHHRSVHFEQLDDDKNQAAVTTETSSSSSPTRFQAVLDAEFELVSQAFFTEPEDQSAWMYHRWLLSQLDAYSSSSSSSSKNAYKIQTLQRELDRITEVSEMEPTCKWPALVCARLHKLLAKEMKLDDDFERRADVILKHSIKAKELYEKLLLLDPLRKGYYRDVLDRML